MKLTLTVTDRRQVYGAGMPKEEPYARVSVVDLDGPGVILAGFLRAVAEDLAPTYAAAEGVSA